MVWIISIKSSNVQRSLTANFNDRIKECKKEHQKLRAKNDVDSMNKFKAVKQ